LKGWADGDACCLALTFLMNWPALATDGLAAQCMPIPPFTYYLQGVPSLPCRDLEVFWAPKCFLTSPNSQRTFPSLKPSRKPTAAACEVTNTPTMHCCSIVPAVCGGCPACPLLRALPRQWVRPASSCATDLGFRAPPVKHDSSTAVAAQAAAHDVSTHTHTHWLIRRPVNTPHYGVTQGSHSPRSRFWPLVGKPQFQFAYVQIRACSSLEQRRGLPRVDN
jgi:hypothetical protein